MATRTEFTDQARRVIPCFIKYCLNMEMAFSSGASPLLSCATSLSASFFFLLPCIPFFHSFFPVGSSVVECLLFSCGLIAGFVARTFGLHVSYGGLIEDLDCTTTNGFLQFFFSKSLTGFVEIWDIKSWRISFCLRRFPAFFRRSNLPISLISCCENLFLPMGCEGLFRVILWFFW